jgi:hypothetical protein
MFCKLVVVMIRLLVSPPCGLSPRVDPYPFLLGILHYNFLVIEIKDGTITRVLTRTGTLRTLLQRSNPCLLHLVPVYVRITQKL